MQREYEFTMAEKPTYNFTANAGPSHEFEPSQSVNVQGTKDYNALTNKPSINGNTLEGDKTAEELGIHIPHDTNDLTNGAGFLTISDLPIYNGGVE